MRLDSNQTWPIEWLTKEQFPGFDQVYYLDRYPDIREAGVDPLQHFMDLGWREGRDPSPGFNVAGYLAANPDVRESGGNPLLHYLNYGLAQGRVGHTRYMEQQEASTTLAADPIDPSDVWGARARENLSLPPHGWLDVLWLLQDRVWPKVFGHVPESWWAPEVFRALGVPTGGKWLSLGCGPGHAEIALLQHGSVDEILGMDPSSGAIQVANELALGAGVADRAKFAISAMDLPEFEPNSADVVHMNMSLHHIHDLEWVFAQIFTALKPGGYFVANEFVGPKRFQWSEQRIKIVTDFLATIPDHLRRDYRDNSVKVRQQTYPAEWWIANDPTESVRSNEILPLLMSISPETKVYSYAGNIANLVLENIIHNFDPQRDEDKAVLARLWEEDDKCAEAEGPDFVYIVASKSADGREMKIARKIAAEWVGHRNSHSE
ncbi:class I SAM-dependent methyltransferase [Methylobacterium sp. HMF5984]|uniref:class I SAM-dependent methyltransferase n=1 Tax=Methylobacterium sp. HMF5984 TaxID=3367370 RepID=UPI003853FF38